ncbi:hypothetical protein ABZS66_52975 [Dactylosporangium sp. NPDC005572]|uniref:nSTAND1 domain-containing NTPase n=1 Tax=Dactylosporangium sp. NPDC005572 TaxID=3156889 RepID=UPI0033AE31F8
MGRPEKPLDPSAGPAQRLAWQLRRLRDDAGGPGYRQLARRVHFSASTLADAAKGDRLPSLEVTLAYAAACGGDADEWRARWTAAREALDAPLDAPLAGVDEERCPYQGLAPFEPERAEWFFGRDDLVERLLRLAGRQPVVGVVGASGSGKSSLLRAGLLGAGRWRALLLTPTERPLDALAEQVAKLSGRDLPAVRDELAADPAALDVAVRAALAAGPPEDRLLLVVDQFEELFTLCADDAERDRFVAALLDACRGPARRGTLVIGLRADFLAHLTRAPDLAEALAEGEQLLVGPLTPAGLRDVVVRPAAHAGLRVEPALVTTILADAAGEPGALPLLSHALLETWLRRDPDGLTLAAYRASGGLHGAIAQTAERVHADFSPPEREAARRVFLRLTALGQGTADTRRRIALSELDGLSDGTGAVLDRLAEARLVVLGGDGTAAGDGTRTAEVAHEALIRAWPRLHRWLTGDRADLVVHRRLTEAAQTWAALGRDAGALYRGTQLATAGAWAADHPAELNRLEAAFLRAGAAQAAADEDRTRRQNRRLRVLAAGVTVLLVAAVAAGGQAFRQRQDAREQQRTALAGELALRSRALLATDPALAGLLAVEAHALRPGPDTLGSVLSAAAAPRRVALNVGGPSVYGVAFTPDRSLLAAALADGGVALWDPDRGTPVARFTGHAGRAAGVAFADDGRLLFSLGIDGTEGAVLVRDTRTGRELARYAEPGAGSVIAVTADGARFAVPVAAGIALHDRRTGTRTLLPSPLATSLSFSADGALLVAAGGAGPPVVWDTAGATPVAHLPADGVTSALFDPAGPLVAGSADGHGVHLWSVAPGAVTALPPLPGLFSWAASAPAGGRLAVVDEGGAVTVWDLARRVPVAAFHDRGRSETVMATLSRDGTMLASAGFNGTIVVHDLRGAPFGGFTGAVQDVRVSPDGRTVATAHADRAVRLWDRAGRPLATLDGHPDEVEAIAFSPDGRRLAAVSRDNTVTVWDVAGGRPALPAFRTTTAGASTDVAYAPDGRSVAVATLGPYVWDVSDPAGPSDATARFPARIVTSLAYSPDGRHLVGASVGGYLNLWDAATGALVRRVNAGQGALQDVAVSPDGTLLALAGDGRTVTLWDAGGAARVATLDAHTAPVQVLAFSPDGRLLASAGDDRTIVLWDVPTRRRLAVLTGHESRIRGLAFLPGGTLLSAAEDGRVTAWPLDAEAAADRVCAAAARPLTRAEWAEHLGDTPYRPACPRP